MCQAKENMQLWLNRSIFIYEINPPMINVVEIFLSFNGDSRELASSLLWAETQGLEFLDIFLTAIINLEINTLNSDISAIPPLTKRKNFILVSHNLLFQNCPSRLLFCLRHRRAAARLRVRKLECLMSPSEHGRGVADERGRGRRPQAKG